MFIKQFEEPTQEIEFKVAKTIIAFNVHEPARFMNSRPEHRWTNSFPK
ncbi:hypothetical protein DSM3645_20682 [Blastopirellula marina DSM 3645]|uniref:Uncharacterized protein n=1 Tax=Blastopirellula marina DSM 3645 TaxID=314230 RepID=A3ZQT6_9BACT|nr:hypothetical protein DSM3645_20682 [Blastopirellula marina DSM 3645]